MIKEKENNKCIWIFNQNTLIPSQPGISRHFDIAKELTCQGYKVFIFSSNYNHYTKEDIFDLSDKSYHFEIFERINYYWIKNNIKYTSNSVKRFLNWLEFAYRVNSFEYKSLDKPDIIIGSSPPLFTALASYFVSKKFMSTKFVLEIRDLYPETMILLGWSKCNPFILLQKFIEKYLYSNSDYIIYLPTYADKYISSIVDKKDKLTWIPSGYGVLENTQSIRKNKELWSLLSKPKKKIAYIGSFGNVYPLEYLINAIEILNKNRNDIILIFLGYGHKEDFLKGLVKEKNLKNIYFQSPIPKNQIQEFLQECDVLFNTANDSPLYQYGTNTTKMRDYFYSGVPVVSATTFKDDLVRLSGFGYNAHPYDAQEIANKINIALNISNQEKAAIGLGAKQYLIDHYSIELVCKKLIHFFEKIK